MRLVSDVLRLDNDDLQSFLSALLPRILPRSILAKYQSMPDIPILFSILRARGGEDLPTFLPAYLPRVMMATRPTLRTIN